MFLAPRNESGSVTNTDAVVPISARNSVYRIFESDNDSVSLGRQAPVGACVWILMV